MREDELGKDVQRHSVYAYSNKSQKPLEWFESSAQTRPSPSHIELFP